jgi:hypothetical protein
VTAVGWLPSEENVGRRNESSVHHLVQQTTTPTIITTDKKVVRQFLQHSHLKENDPTCCLVSCRKQMKMYRDVLDGFASQLFVTSGVDSCANQPDGLVD